MKQYIIALDQGTTSSRAIAFDRAGRIIAMAQKELTQIYPQPGYVEQDPLEIYATQSGVLAEVRKREHYEKPSVRRKKKSEAARKRKYK